MSVIMVEIAITTVVVTDAILAHALPPVLIAEATGEDTTVTGIEMTTDALAGLLRRGTTILEDIDMTYHPNQTPIHWTALLCLTIKG